MKLKVPITRNRKIIITLAALIAAYCFFGNLYVDYHLKNAKTLQYVAPEAEADEIPTPDTLEEMKNDVLDRLAKCENPHSKPIVFDSNGKASVGHYQWQTASFAYYYEKKTGKKITEWEAAQLALNDTEARALAAYVIFETDNGVKKDWVNCNRWHDLTTLVDFIKKHEN